METALAILICLLIVALFIGLFVCIARMARRRNRDAAVWVLLGILLNPFIITLILLIAGTKRSGD